MKSVIELIAHRGDYARFPENTLPALQGAVAAGAAYIEFDVQFSQDGVPVLLHDATLERTAGVPKSVFDCPVADLVETSVSEAERFGERFAEVTVPTLREAVALLNQTLHVTAFVELKRHSMERFGVEPVIEKLLDTMSDARFPWVMISFVAEAVERFQDVSDHDAGWVLRRYDDPAQATARALSPAYLFINGSVVPPGTDRLWSGPWRWVVYNIDDAANALRCAEMGASLIETNCLREMMAHPALELQASG